MKKNKKLITEQSVGKCQTWTNALLKMMCETGCFPEGISPTTYEGNEMPSFKGQQVGSVPSKTRPGYNAVFFGDYDQSKGGCTVMYYSGDTFDNPLINPATKKPLVKRANCEDMNETLAASIGPDVKIALDSISAYTEGQVVSYETVYKNPNLISQGWELIPLTQAPGYDTWGAIIGRQLKSRPEMVMVWKMSGAKQYQKDQSADCVTEYTNLGYVKSQKPIGKAGFLDVNLKEEPNCGGYFKTDYWMTLDLTKISDQQLIGKLDTDFNKLKNGLNKGDCRSFISSYSTAYDKQLAISQRNLDRYKPIVSQCKRQYNYIFPWINSKLKDLEYAKVINSTTGEPLDYSLQGGRKVAQESLNMLKQTIKENLIRANETKKKVLTEETKIVKSRLLIITENRSLKTKKQKDKFCSDLLSEMIYFNKQGFNKELINEQLWDMMKGIFGNGAEGIMQTFKEYIGSWLVDNLTPIETDGWLGQLIVTSVGNLDFADIPKLTNCDFLTKFLAKNISETMIKKVQTSSEVTGTFYDVLRNSIVETMEQSDLGQKIEKGLVEIICPLLSGVKTKMDTAADKLKQGAVSAAA